MTSSDTNKKPEAGLPISASRLRGLMRYGLAVAAPASVAASHFLVQVFLLAHVQPAEFGTFAFLMVLVQFGYGLSNALISTPYDVGISSGSADDSLKRTITACNFIYSLVFGLGCIAVGFTTSAGSWIFVFAIFGMLAMLRWFGRVFCYASLKPVSAALSDISYAFVLSLAVVILAWTGNFSMMNVCLSFVAASLIGLLFLERRFLHSQFIDCLSAKLGPYRDIWLSQSRWTLLGVVSTESTNNIHSYLITLLAGPAQFAPIGAAALFLRPVNLSMTALTQFERPVMGRAIAAGDLPRAKRIKLRFHLALLSTWCATMVLAGVILVYYPSLIIKPNYNAFEIKLAFVLFAGITLSQLWGMPNSVFLQAARSFKKLSQISVISSIFSICGVLVFLLLLPPVYSLLGILIGQVTMSTQMALTAKKWKPSEPLSQTPV